MSNSRDAVTCKPTHLDVTQIKQSMVSADDAASAWPFYLVSYFILLPHILKRLQITEEDLPRYPIMQQRYNTYGWNRNFQHCYTKEEILLIQRIHNTYQSLISENGLVNYFELSEEKHWYDWWSCTHPNYNALLRKFETDSFTLPSRGAKDATYYPLSNEANNIALRIANWQSERIKHQHFDLMNDPVMLVFEELRDWFFKDLSQKECKNAVLDEISKRLSYIKHLIHTIPDFGPDKLHLLEIEHSLEESTNIVSNCIANKELPQLLSDIVIAGKDLENAIGTYLHFSLIDEEVADNFLPEFLDGGQRNCHSSPVCKIYRAIEESQHNKGDHELLGYQKLSKFYHLIKLDEDNNHVQVQMKLKKSVLATIKFASFVGNRDKENYLEALATLDAMINARSILERFHHIQSRLGTYLFAVNYIETANQLASHYVNLINKAKLLTHQVVKTSNEGLNVVLRNPSMTKQNKYFSQNLKTLETRVAKGTTINAQLDVYCLNAIESMNKYQHMIRKLASDVTSGQAQRELEYAMQDLMQQMKYMNALLPGLLNESPLSISPHSGMEVIACENTSHPSCSIRMLRDTTPQVSETTAPLPDKQTIIPPLETEPTISATQDDLQQTMHTMLTEISKQTTDVCPSVFLPFDSGKWNEAIEIDRYTGQLIHTYDVFDGEKKVGSAYFYGTRNLCRSEDGKRHNIKLSGVLSEFNISDDMNVTEICKVLPPTLFDQVLISASEGAMHGAVMGGAQVVGATLQSAGMSKKMAGYLSQLTYYGSLFTMNMHAYYEQMQEYDDMNRCLNAMYYAALDTGKIVVMNVVLNQLSNLIDGIGDYFKSRVIKKCSSLVRFGIYAQHAIQHGIVQASASVISGIVAEVATEKSGNYLVSQVKNKFH